VTRSTNRHQHRLALCQNDVASFESVTSRLSITHDDAVCSLWAALDKMKERLSPLISKDESKGMYWCRTVRLWIGVCMGRSGHQSNNSCDPSVARSPKRRLNFTLLSRGRVLSCTFYTAASLTDVRLFCFPRILSLRTVVLVRLPVLVPVSDWKHSSPKWLVMCWWDRQTLLTHSLSAIRLVKYQ